MFRLASACACVLLLASASAWAERALLSGSFGLWLHKTAAPELTEVLGNHPKFKGERIRFVALTNGKPAQTSNRLTGAIEQQLTDHILQAGNTDVAWQAGAQSCTTFESQPAFLVGIEVSRLGRSKHKVTMRVLDTRENVWVSGVSLSWSGRLLDAETNALKERMTNTPDGSLHNPIALTQRQQLVRAIHAQITCALPKGVDGTVHVPVAAQPELQLIMRELAQRMLASPTITTTQSAEHAQWHMLGEVSPASFAQEFVVSLVQENDPTAQQRIAAIFVSGGAHATRSITAPAGTPTRVPTTTPATEPTQPFPAQPDTLLSHLRYTETCPRAAKQSCVAVTFDLHENAHILVFRTHNARLRPTTCTTASTRRERGEQRYHVTLPSLNSTGHTGIYVLASRERRVIEKLRKQIQAAPGACRGKGSEQHERWLNQTLERIGQQVNELEWQTLHLRGSRAGLELL